MIVYNFSITDLENCNDNMVWDNPKLSELDKDIIGKIIEYLSIYEFTDRKNVDISACWRPIDNIDFEVRGRSSWMIWDDYPTLDISITSTPDPEGTVYEDERGNFYFKEETQESDTYVKPITTFRREIIISGVEDYNSGKNKVLEALETEVGRHYDYDSYDFYDRDEDDDDWW